jgi:hypothetical protein
MVLSLDTAIARTGNAMLAGALADSAVVTGVATQERLGSFCRVRGQDQHGEVVGLIQTVSQEQWTPARVAWIFDTSTSRIRQLPPDSIVCAVAPEGY